MKIGKLTRMTAEGPERNATLVDTADTTFCSIACPAIPIPKTAVISFQLNATLVGVWIACGLVALFGVFSVTLYGAFEFSSAVIFMALLGVVFLAVRYRKLTLYSVIVHTSDPKTPRIDFYRTFDAFDFALVLDWLSWSVGERPRTCTGVMTRLQE